MLILNAFGVYNQFSEKRYNSPWYMIFFNIWGKSILFLILKFLISISLQLLRRVDLSILQE